MNQILSENLNKTLAKKQFSYDFEIKEQGLYGIEITASAQEGKKFLFFKRDDSDLKLIINGEI